MNKLNQLIKKYRPIILVFFLLIAEIALIANVIVGFASIQTKVFYSTAVVMMGVVTLLGCLSFLCAERISKEQKQSIRRKQ